MKSLRIKSAAAVAVFTPPNSLVALHHVQGVAGLLLAILAGTAFFCLLLFSVLLAYRSSDEFRRALLLRSFLWATGLTMGMVCVWGYVDLFAPLELPHLPLALIPMVLLVIMTAAKLLIFRQHRVLHEEPAA